MTDLTCAICCETIKDMEDANQKAVLRCGHEYHPACILKWFTKKNSCPNCRRPHFEQDVDLSETPIFSDTLNTTIRTLIPSRRRMILELFENEENYPHVATPSPLPSLRYLTHIYQRNDSFLDLESDFPSIE